MFARHWWWILAVVSCLVLAVSARAQAPHALQYQLVTRDAVAARLRSALYKNAQREAALMRLFEQSGCDSAHLTEEPVEHERLPNVICTLPGQSDSTIIVGAHFDHVTKGWGVIDNWSGASLLPSLLESVRHQPRKHTFLFIGFSSEEQGLIGSKFFVRHLTQDQANRIQVMINLDTLALGPTEVWLHHSDSRYVAALFSLAKIMKLPVSIMNVDNVGDDDSDSFLSRKIPTLMVHSVTRQTWPILHSASDTFSAVRFDDYYDTYRLLAAYLAYIDLAGN